MKDDLSRAAQIHRRIVEIFKKQDPQHPNVAMAKINLAAVLSDMGENEEALKAANFAYRVYQKLGPMKAFSMVRSTVWARHCLAWGEKQKRRRFSSIA